MGWASVRRRFIRQARAAITKNLPPIRSDAVQLNGYAYDTNGNMREVHLYTWVVALIRSGEMPRETVLAPALAPSNTREHVVLALPTARREIPFVDVAQEVLGCPQVLRAFIFPRGTKATLETVAEKLPSLKGWNRLRWRFELPVCRSEVTPLGLRLKGQITAVGLRPIRRLESY